MRAMMACLLALAVGTTVTAGELDTNLAMALEQMPGDQVVSVLVYLDEQLDAAAAHDLLTQQRARMAQRHAYVVTALRHIAVSTQDGVLSMLETQARAGQVADYKPYWVANIIRVEATPDAIRAIAARDDVRMVYWNYPIELIEPVRMGEPHEGGSRVPEIGVQAVRAPEVWAMGYTGAGVLVANIDTGVDGNHPALNSRWAANADPLHYFGHPEWAWFDPYAGQNSFPYDNGGHGTHTMGSVCGGAPGDQVGVAPGAKWIAAGAIDRGGGIETTVADAIESFQWMVDPDGNPSTHWDVPAVCSNSWGLTSSHGYPSCDQTFWIYLDNCEAAGIVILFSAGNEGTSGLRRPADRATTPYNVCAVAAVDAGTSGWPIASFSSRGPTYCTPNGSAAIKPDIAAPGVNVRSSYPGGGYAVYSGTSMASPHVNGVVALMRQANPELSVEQVKQIIYQTAYDLGTPGEDNSYGWGMIDAYEAVQLALSTVALSFNFPNGRPELISPYGGTTIRVVVSGEDAVPGTGMLYYSSGGPYTAIPMQIVSPNVYDAVFPGGFDCGATITYYFSAEATGGEIVYNPYNAPASYYAGSAYTGRVVFMDDAFETDQGWTVFAGADLGNWERADPQQVTSGIFNPVITQPEDDHTENGTLCYVTGPLAGSSAGSYDVDGGPSRLTSPVLALAGTDAVVSYWRWYHISTQWNDELVVEVSNNNGASWVVVETVDDRVTWTHVEWRVGDYVTPTDQVRVRFTVDDTPNDSLVEALIDDFLVEALVCEAPPLSPGDMDCDGDVDFDDIDPFVLALQGQAAYEAQFPDCEYLNGDMDEDGDVDFDDIDPFVEALQ